MSNITTLEEVENQISLDLLDQSERKFKDYRPGHQYAVAIIKAENKLSQFGQLQVQIDVAALDDTGAPSSKSTRIWLDYPTPPEGREAKREFMLKARDEMARILRAQSPDFNAYGSVDKVGTKRVYTGHDGNVLDSAGIKNANTAAMSKVLTELNLRLKDASRWIGTTGYATFVEFVRKNGKTVRTFQNFGPTPMDKFPLLSDPSDFFA